MNKEIKSIKIKSEGGVEIKFSESQANAQKEVVYKDMEIAHPDLLSGFQKLIPSIYKILQLPKEWRAGKLAVTGVTFGYSEKTNVHGATITGYAILDTSNAPFNFSTPYLTFSQATDEGDSPLMDAACIKYLDDIKKEALAYMDGKKAQASMDV